MLLYRDILTADQYKITTELLVLVFTNLRGIKSRTNN